MQNSEFASRKRHWVRTRLHHPTSDIDSKLTYDNDRFRPSRASSRERADARRELSQRKWLAKIVVGTCIQAINTVFDHCASGEEQHGKVNALPSPTAEQLKTRSVWQGDVEHDHVMSVRTNRCVSFVTPTDDIGRDPFKLQANLEPFLQYFVILDYQNTHIWPFQEAP